jgi:16S rRNA (cytosine1402-N4)-methyltransferase
MMRFHDPVLVSEVLHYINIADDDGYFCDCTVGGGGHLLAMLKQTKKANFIGIEWDPEAITYATEQIKTYKDRIFLFRDNFVKLGLILDRLNIQHLTGILFDLGVSLHQLVTDDRGFSFQRSGALSMAMAPENTDLLNVLRNASKTDITRVLKQYGDVRNYRRIGNAIYEHRRSLRTTFDLRKIVEINTPRRFLKKNLHRVFQSMRIWVNDEFENLRKALVSAVNRLRVGGRIVVISYHSGEDRVVKTLFRSMNKKGQLALLHKKVIRPTEDEIKSNPRARSAKLRAGEKCVLS